MTRHAKNAHSSPVFSHFERSQLPYGSKKQRLGAESMRKFDSCNLCLNQVREPVSCKDGHLYCRECILESLLSQKKAIKTHKATLERLLKEEEEQKEEARLKARERVLLDFEKSQFGLGNKLGASGSGPTKTTSEEARGTKRKFEFDQESMDKAALDAENAALAKIEAEQAEARKAKLPAFWLPSLTPEAGKAAKPLKDIKLETQCYAGKFPHAMSLKELITVKFTPDSSSTSSSLPPSAPKTSICPSCSKELTNSSTAVLMKGCGHVTCKLCSDRIVKPGKQCVVCEAKVSAKDLIQLVRDGTGFASGGQAEAVSIGVAYQ